MVHWYPQPSCSKHISLACFDCQLQSLLAQGNTHIFSQTRHTYIYTPQPELSPTALRGGCVKRQVGTDAQLGTGQPLHLLITRAVDTPDLPDRV